MQVIKSYGMEDGLTSSYITSLYRDSRGFLWTGTRKGLQRFDGTVFKTYYNRSAVPHIAEDSRGNIYFTSAEGRLYRIVFSGRSSVTECLDSSHQASEHLNGLAPDANGNMWVLSSMSGLIRYSVGGKTEKHMEALPLAKRKLLSIRSHGKGVLLAGLDRSLNFYDPATRQLRQLTSVPAPILAIDQTGEDVWLSCENQIWRYNTLTSRKEQVFLGAPDKAPNRWSSTILIARDFRDNVYINSNQGLVYAGKKQSYFQAVSFLLAEGNPSPNALVTSLIFQNDYLAWVGTEKGLLRCTLKNKKIKNYRLNDYFHEKLPLKIRSILEIGQDTFLAGSSNNNGLYLVILNGAAPLIEHYYHPSTQPINTVNIIRKDRKGHIWLGTNSYLLSYDPQSKKLREYPRISFVWDMVPDSLGGYWCAIRDNGIAHINPADPDKPDYFPMGKSQITRVWQIFPYKHVFLLATTNGLHYFNPQTGLYDQGLPELDPYLSRITGKLWHIDQLSPQELVISSENNGIHLLDLKKGEVKTYTYEKLHFFGFLKDTNQNLWIVTDIGLAYFNTTHRTFQILGSYDGLPTGNFSFKGIYKRNNGEMVFTGDHGFSILSPSAFGFRAQKGHIHVTSLMVSGNEYSDFVSKPSHYEFAYHENNLSFRLSDLGLGSYTGIHYLLKGADPVWELLEHGNQVIYKNLSPGNYALYALTEGDTSDLTSLPPVLTFRIIPPYWKQPWFILLSGFFLVGAVSGLLYSRFRNVKKRYQNEMKRLESEIKALRSQINPHFIFNALSSIQYFVLHNQSREAHQYLARFAVLMRRILDYSSLEYISLAEEISLLENYLSMEKMRFEDRIDWDIHLDADISGQECIPTLLLQPIVENAVLHGIGSRTEGGKISIGFERQERYILCVIRDNGTGIQPHGLDNLHDSKGLKMLRERLEHINRKYLFEATLHIHTGSESGLYPGTEVRIQLPILSYSNDA